MTKDEILLELENKGVINSIGSHYSVTDIFKQFLTNLKPVNTIEIVEAVSTELNTFFAPILKNVSVENRLEFILDEYKIPVRHQSPTSTYLVRNNDSTTRNFFEELFVSNEVDGKIMMNTVVYYYSDTEYPKSLSKLISSGDILVLYNEQKKSGKIINQNKQSGTWL